MSEDSELNSDQQKQLIKELKQRMMDDGEYIYTLAERCQQYYEHILKHKAENQHLTDKIHQLYEGAEEQKQRIKRLEEAGDAIVDYNIGCGCGQDGPCRACRMACEEWRKAKEAKP